MPPRHVYGWANRFDDIERQFRSLYCSAQRLTCLREVLADFRLNTKAIAEFRELFGESAQLPRGKVPLAFRARTVLAGATIHLRDGNLVDIDSVVVRAGLEERLARLLADYGMDHLNIGEIRSEDRAVTQTIARVLYDDGAAGIIFKSKLDDEPCAALFERRAYLASNGVFEPLSGAFPDLLQVCAEYGLVLAPAAEHHS